MQTAHRPQQKHHNSSTLDRLDRPRQQIRGDGLKVLEDEHAERLTEDLGGILVVGVPDVGHAHKELKGRLLVRFSDPSLDVPLDLGLSLFSVTEVKVKIKKESERQEMIKTEDQGVSPSEAKIFLVAP